VAKRLSGARKGKVSTIKSVLMVGNDGAFLVELIQKFYKEGWHIDLLSEQAMQSHLPGEVEQYVFPYASASAEELIESCTPQLVIFAGAYNMPAPQSKETDKTETGAYIAGLNNLLMSAGKAGVAQFAYLSSNAVFEAPSAKDIPEDAELTPKTPAGLRIAQGETVAAAFGRYSETDVTVIRLGDLFCIPRSQEECVDRVTQLCLSALLTGTVTVNAKRISAPLFVSDAVFSIYQILTASKRSAPVYHLAASEEADEEDVAQAIKRTFSKPVTIVDQTTGVTDRRVLSGALAAQEFLSLIHISEPTRRS
jgi:nucleoside-diphosphate-sugar epimerase